MVVFDLCLVLPTSKWVQAANTRQACSATLLAFLLDYPLGPKRVEFHFNFLLSNLQVPGMLTSPDAFAGWLDLSLMTQAPICMPWAGLPWTKHHCRHLASACSDVLPLGAS